MPVPTCECVAGLPPYDRLTAIYQAVAELSGDESLPDPLCVAGVPPFQRFPYIYEALSGLAEDESLPNRLCVMGESPQDQVSRIYQAAAVYADDASLLSYECVRGMPIWQQWIEIYRALYLAAGSPEGLVDPACVSIANLDVLSDVFCALTADGGGTAVLIASFDIADPENIASFSRESAAGFTGNGDPFAYQREAAADVLRSVHYQTIGPLVLLEEIPTLCQLVAPGTPTVVPDNTDYQATYTGIPVTASLLRYEVGLDAPGVWTPNGTNLIYDGSGAAGTHTFRVRAVSTSGVPGATATSAPFDLVGVNVDPSDYGTPLQYNDETGLAAGAISSWAFNTWGEDLVQATGAAQPTGVLNVINGLPVARFDGSDFLTRSALTATGVGLFMLIIPEDFQYNALGTTNITDYWNFVGDGYFGTFRNARIDAYPAGANLNDGLPHLVEVHSTAAGYQVYIDGVGQGAQAADFTAGTAFTVGADATGTVRFLHGDIAMVCVMDAAGLDRAGLCAAFMNKYGL